MLPLHIYTEGDKQRGLGHLTRCSAIAEAWKKSGGQIVWHVDGDELARNFLIGEKVEWEAWQSTLLNAIEILPFALIDSYSASLECITSLASRFKSIVFIDDTFRLPYPCGVVIHAAPSQKSVPPGDAQWKFGPKWQPLRPAFWGVTPVKSINKVIKNILIIMGGTDVHNITEKIARIIIKSYPDALLHIVSRNAILKIKNCKIYSNVNDKGMVNLMMSCDLAISAGGQTVFELAKCGVPGILICVAQNQEAQLNAWSKLGAFIYSCWWNDAELERKLSLNLELISNPVMRLAMRNVAQEEMVGNAANDICKYLKQE